MENNKLFKSKISMDLQNEIVDFFKDIHDRKIKINNNKKAVEKQSKIHLIAGVIGAGIGLVTFSMVVLNQMEMANISKNVINLSGGIAGISYLANQHIYKNLQRLRGIYLNSLQNASFTKEYKQYTEFEQKLVKGLNGLGIEVECQKYTNYASFASFRDMENEVPEFENALKEKTSRYVKGLIEEYNIYTPRTKNKI